MSTRTRVDTTLRELGYARIPDFDEEHRLGPGRDDAGGSYRRHSWLWPLSRLYRKLGQRLSPQHTSSHPTLSRRLVRSINVILLILFTCILITAVFFPSYNQVPPHYRALHERMKTATKHQTNGAGNPFNETVFIAAVLYDPEGTIASGDCGRAVLRLIEYLGRENVFLSIYENNSGPQGKSALQDLASNIPCNYTTFTQDGLDLDNLRVRRVTLPDSEQRIRRIDYLAAVRNAALLPLQEMDEQGVVYDRLLYLNDVIFDPVEAAQLLFATNAHAHAHGKARYRAACAVDFTNPFKFYDTYATRDAEGYEIGLPLYPWFTGAGGGRSRADVLAGRDAVRVRSCWGGMVAFDAGFFQGPDAVRFRAPDELFWDASECCFVHADIQTRPSRSDWQSSTHRESDTGIFMNPFIRVAYDARTHSWLWTTRRFERLYPLAHSLFSGLFGYPGINPRRGEVPGQAVRNTVWTMDRNGQGRGDFTAVERMAGNDGFCGRRGMELLVEDRVPGQDGFEAAPISQAAVNVAYIAR
ncbi:cryptococcal mannosyltransferase 1-domain-containing protein [Aspergillus multicolor]|uniref:glycosyltransferase family 69 protein n=1 Tax=Aspergillus multicolor TaxID=41759 RepID=UPI003CCDB13F